MKKHEQIDENFEKQRMDNHIYLIGFKRFLEYKKLSQKTIDRHVKNIDFYINTFLLHSEPLEACQGITMLDYYLGYWYISKTTFASASSIKENIASLKHFYTYMNKNGQVRDEEVIDMKSEIKVSKGEWINTVKKYGDLSIDIEGVWEY